MKYLAPAPASLLLLLTFSAGDAAADEVADARADLADALDETRDDSRRCEQQVGPILEDMLRVIRPRMTQLRVRRLLRDLGDARDAARVCGRRVRRLLRSADRSLSRYAGGGDDGYERPEPRPRPRKKRIIVPEASWSADCKTQWYMIELIDMAGADPADRAAVVQIGNIACGSAPITELTWPNGRTARYRNGEWRYPNGRAARYANGELRYPNGRAARYANGELRYPDGRAAKYSNGEWRFPNGRRAGTWQSVENFACGASADGCKTYRERRRSSDPVFSELLLVREAWEASKRR